MNEKKSCLKRPPLLQTKSKGEIDDVRVGKSEGF